VAAGSPRSNADPMCATLPHGGWPVKLVAYSHDCTSSQKQRRSPLFQRYVSSVAVSANGVSKTLGCRHSASEDCTPTELAPRKCLNSCHQSKSQVLNFSELLGKARRRSSAVSIPHTIVLHSARRRHPES
jgi:hypothetical protein